MLAQPCRRCVKRWSAIQPLPTAPRALFASVAGRSHDFRSVVQPQRGQGVLRPTTGVFHQFRELHASSDSAAPTDKTHHNGSDGDGGADADADDTNGANNRGRQSTQTRRVVKVAALKDVVAALRPALLRIHPDAVARFPDKVASTNQRSVQTLQGLLHSLKDRCDTKALTAVRSRVSVGSTGFKDLKLPFFFDCPKRKALHRVVVAASVPAALEMQTKSVATKSQAQRVAAKWTAFAMRVVQQVLNKVELPYTLELDEDLRDAGRLDARGKPHRSKAFGRDAFNAQHEAEAASLQDRLKENLLRESPLVQGKMFYRPKQFMFAESLWTLKERRARVGSIVERGQLTVDTSVEDPEVARGALSLLVNCLVYHYDALFVYHEMWTGLRVVIRDGPYAAVPEVGVLMIPAMFVPHDFVEFVQDKWEDMHTPALEDAMKKARRDRRRAKKKGPRWL